ncbi:MAG: HEAT repeat domain-containing protein [Planctomycetes bacterium]|nr:HEAT repeat domain-containing protein [Planctomycetota bacterium]
MTSDLTMLSVKVSRFRIRSVLGGLAAVLALTAPVLFSAPRQDPKPLSEAELIEKIKGDADRAEPKLLDELADLKTRSALDGLIEAYPIMSTIFMKREIVRRLPRFDGVPDAEQPALQKLMDVATTSEDIELRTAAVSALGECPSKGKDFLVMIVESRADDATRELALDRHIKLSDKSDHAWYKELWKSGKDRDDTALKQKADPKKKDPKPKGKDKDKPADKGADKDEGGKKGAILNNMRLSAFQQIAEELTPEELYDGVKDVFWKVRVTALETLDSRGDKKVADVAHDIFNMGIDPKGQPENPEVRTVGAKIVARALGPKVADEFLKKATSLETPLSLRRGLAEILIGMHDEGVDKMLVSELGKGKAGQKLFTMWACKGMQDEKVDKALVKLLQDKDGEVVISAAKLLADRKYKDAVPALARLVGKGKDRDRMFAALQAMTELRVGDRAWVDELVAMTKGEDPELRNLAIQALGGTRDASYLPALIAALEDANWSTRLAALEALEHMRSKDAVTAIIARMAKEDGRMQNEFANTLWRLTGQPFQDNVDGWSKWWENSKGGFAFLTEDKLREVRSGEEEWRLKQTTHVKTEFFGIKIISHHVIFIIDVSGSMNWGLLNEYQGMSGQSRIEVAKTELLKCVGGLDPSAFFNVVIFSSGVERWIDGSLAAASQKNRDEAKSYIERIGAGGGTNLYGAVKEAFEDKDVDTIFILSDGEPSVGDETDPVVIREHVKAWNEHRGIVINTIQIAGQFQVLDWLAEDSGGTHVKYE